MRRILPTRSARASARLRLTLACVASVAAALATPACLPDHDRECGELYRHLATLREDRRLSAPAADDLEARFVAACSAAFEKDRHACLSAAEDLDAALACKASRLRPR